MSSAMPSLTGHFAVFNEWTEINSVFEGRFLERIAPDAFTRTFREDRASMRVLFQHGRDAYIGDKPLGPIAELQADTIGARYRVPLLDTTYNRDLLPALEAGLFGASFRFQAVRDEWAQEPPRSTHNPGRLPERTITEARVMEFGPVTFPAYAKATAGVTEAGRSAPTVARQRGGVVERVFADAEPEERVQPGATIALGRAGATTAAAAAIVPASTSTAKTAISVFLADDARARILGAANWLSGSDGLETGGPLMGVFRDGRAIDVRAAWTSTTARGRTSVELDLERGHGAHLGASLVGDWHSHPSHDARPSQRDLVAWRAAARHVRAGGHPWVSIIATAPRYRTPTLHAFLTGADGATTTIGGL